MARTLQLQDSLASAFHEDQQAREDAQWNDLLQSAPDEQQQTTTAPEQPKSQSKGVVGTVASAVGAGASTFAQTGFSGVKKFLSGTWNLGRTPDRRAAADILEGLLEMVASPAMGAGAAVQDVLTSLDPATAAKEVLPGGKGSIAGSIRRILQAPIAIVEGIRSGKTNPTPEEEQILDAPMTYGELLNIGSAVAAGPMAAKLTKALRRAAPDVLQGKPTTAAAESRGGQKALSPAPTEIENQRALPSHSADVREAGPSSLENEMPVIAGGSGLLKTYTDAQRAQQIMAESGAEFRGVTEGPHGEPLYWIHDSTTGSTGVVGEHQLNPNSITRHLEESRFAFEVAKVGKQLEGDLAQNGGFSYSLQHGPVQFPEGSMGVSIAPELERTIAGRATAHDIGSYLTEHRRVLQDPRAALGGWYDAATNKTHLDISIAAKADEANAIGASVGQRALYNPKTGESVPVVYGETGPHPYHAPSETLKPQDVEVAKAYDAAKTDPALRPHWDALASETDRLYAEIEKKVKIEPVQGQPYASAEQMAKEVKETGVLKVSTDNNEHPFWTPEQNLKFRVVHDYLGHVETGNDFSLQGEYRAWLAHERLIENEAAKIALKTEVYGQAAAAVANSGAFQEQKAVNLGGNGLPPIEERLAKGLDLGPQTEQASRRGAMSVSTEARDAYDQIKRNEVMLQQLEAAKERIKTFVRDTFTDQTGAMTPGAELTDAQFRRMYKDLITVGAIEIHRGAKSFKDFSTAVIAATGEFIKPRLKQLFEESKALLEKRIVQAGAQGLPSVQKLAELQRQGADGGVWYHDVMPELTAAFGEEGVLVRKFIAATSPLHNVPDNVSLALEAYAKLSSGEGYRAMNFGLANPPIKGNLDRVVDWWHRGAPAGEEPLSGMKVVPFDRAMAGDVNAFVADRWIWRLFYGKDVGTPQQYDFMQKWAAREAQELGVSIRDLQAMWWTSYKAATEADQGRMTGTIAPMRDVIRQKIAEGQMPELDASGMNEAGKINAGVVWALARALAGAVVGGSTGDTPEERFRNALIGMGLGAIASPALIRSMIRTPESAPGLPKGFSEAAAQARKTALSQTPYQPNYNYIKADPEVRAAMRASYKIAHDKIEAGRQGVQSHDKTQAMADNLISSGEMTVESVLDKPASTDPVPAHELLAMRNLEIGIAEHTTGVKDRVLAGTANPGELRQALALQGAFAERVSLAKTGVARALESLKIGAEAETGRITPEMLAKFADTIDPRMSDMDLARALDTAERVGGKRASSKLASFIKAAPEWFMEGFYGSILWGKAIGHNFFGNLTLEISSDVVHQVGAFMPKGLPFVTPSEGWLKSGIVPGEAAARVHGHIEGWRKITEAYARLNAIDEAGAGKFNLVHSRDYKPAIKIDNPSTVFEHALNYLGAGLRGSTTILEKNDVWTKSHMVSAAIFGMAHRRATIEGLTGKAFQERYMELVDDPTKFTKAERQEIARTVRQDTYTSDIENPMFSAISDAIGRHPYGNAAARFLVFAFPRITSNMFETFTSYTPGLNVLSTRFWNAMKAGGAEAQAAYGRLALGTAIYGTLLYYADEGILTGDKPTDPAHKGATQQESYQARSIRLPGTDQWVSYRGLGFLEDILATAANSRAAFSQIPSKDLPAVTMAFALSMWDAVDNMAFVNTFGQFSSILGQTKRPEARVEDFRKFLEQKSISVIPFSGGLRELRKTVDPVRREATTYLQRFMDTVPGLSTLKDKDGNYLVPPSRDLLTGNPISVVNYPLTTSTAAEQHDPVWQEVWRLGTTVAAPVLRPVPNHIVPGLDSADAVANLSPNQLDKSGLALTPQEKDRWSELMTQVIKLGGKTLHQRLEDLVASPRYKKQSDPTKAALIADEVNGFRNASRDALVRESPALRKELMRVRSENEIKKLPPERQQPALEALRSRIRISP